MANLTNPEEDVDVRKLIQTSHLWITRNSVPMIIAALSALLLSFVDYEFYQKLTTASFEGLSFFGHALNLRLAGDFILLGLFGLVGVEVVESRSPGGVLHNPKGAVNILLATIGGVSVPPILYVGGVVLCYGFTSPTLSGWGCVTPTDIALSAIPALFIFGAGHPATKFLLLLAGLDDLIGIIIVALVYPDPSHPLHLPWLGLSLAGVGIAKLMKYMGVRPWWLYVVGPGSLSLAGFALSGVHFTLALVPVVLCMPHELRNRGEFEEPTSSEHSSVSEMKRILEHILPYGLAIFSFANCGVKFGQVGKLTGVVAISLVAGKTLGIAGGSWLASRFFRAPRPVGISQSEMWLVSLLGGIGFTVSVFIGGIGLPAGEFRDSAVLGAALTNTIIIIGPVISRFMRISRLE